MCGTEAPVTPVKQKWIVEWLGTGTSWIRALPPKAHGVSTFNSRRSAQRYLKFRKDQSKADCASMAIAWRTRAVQP